MNEPLVSIDVIARSAREAVERGLPVTACPYPPDSAAGIRWALEYHAIEMQEIAELTT